MDEYCAKLGERVALLEEHLKNTINAHNNLVKELKQLEKEVKKNGDN